MIYNTSPDGNEEIENEYNPPLKHIESIVGAYSSLPVGIIVSQEEIVYINDPGSDYLKSKGFEDPSMIVNIDELLRNPEVQGSFSEISFGDEEEDMYDVLTIIPENPKEDLDLGRVIRHELGSHIAVILGSSELAITHLQNLISGASRNPDTTKQKILNHAQKINQSTLKLTNGLQLLDYYNKLLSGKYKAEYGFYESSQITQMIKSLVSDDELHRIDFQINPDMQNMQLDKAIFSVVTSNIIGNALKYSNRSIVVSIDQNEDDRLIVEVCDEGIGIPKENIDQIFDPMYRANNSNGVQGSGIGLHLVKQSIDIVGGDIKVHSKVDQGSSFIVTF